MDAGKPGYRARFLAIMAASFHSGGALSVEIAAVRVGMSVTRLAVRRWLAGRSTRDGAGKDLVELIKTGFPDEIKRRRVQRQFDGIADSVAERLLTFAGREFGGLTDGDREAALHEVVRTPDSADRRTTPPSRPTPTR